MVGFCINFSLVSTIKFSKFSLKTMSTFIIKKVNNLVNNLSTTRCWQWPHSEETLVPIPCWASWRQGTWGPTKHQKLSRHLSLNPTTHCKAHFILLILQIRKKVQHRSPRNWQPSLPGPIIHILSPPLENLPLTFLPGFPIQNNKHRETH